MISTSDKSWEEYPIFLRRGTCIKKSKEINDWVTDLEIPIFSENKNYITEVLCKI